MRRTSRSNSKKARVPENLQDLAAWLYTDLLLGLAVAFVGAGTFLVWDKTKNSGPGDTPVVLTYQLSCDEVSLIVPATIGTGALNNRVVTAINDAAISRSWKEPKPGLLYIYGGTGGADVGVGSRLARQFDSVTASNAQSIGNVEKQFGGDKSLSTNQVKLDLYVVYKGDEKKNGCKQPD
jgi:hypothetical protein